MCQPMGMRHEVDEASRAGQPGPVSWRWRRIGQVVSISAVGWVIWQWRDQWPQVGRVLAGADPFVFALGLALAGAGAYLTVFSFYRLVKRCVVADATYREVAHLYFASQLLKHLPGRVWGIGYQMARGRSRGGAMAWVAANIAQMGLATYFALVISASVLLALDSAMRAVVFLISAGVAYLAAPPLGRLAGKRLSPGQRFPRAMKVLETYLALPGKDWAGVAFIFLLSGVLQYLAWVAFGSATGLLSPEDAIHLFALYLLAWFVGWISLFTPSGLGVREVVFLALATSFEPEAVAAMAVIGRASMLVTDLLAGVLHLREAPAQARG